MTLVCWECVADLSSKKQIWCKLQSRSNKIEKRTGSGSGRLNTADPVGCSRPNSLLSSGMLAPLVTTLLLIPVASYYTVAEDLKSLKEVYCIS